MVGSACCVLCKFIYRSIIFTQGKKTDEVWLLRFDIKRVNLSIISNIIGQIGILSPLVFSDSILYGTTSDTCPPLQAVQPELPWKYYSGATVVAAAGGRSGGVGHGGGGKRSASAWYPVLFLVLHDIADFEACTGGIASGIWFWLNVDKLGKLVRWLVEGELKNNYHYTVSRYVTFDLWWSGWCSSRYNVIMGTGGSIGSFFWSTIFNVWYEYRKHKHLYNKAVGGDLFQVSILLLL